MSGARRWVSVLVLAVLMATAVVATATSTTPAQESDFLLHLPVIGKPPPGYWARAYGLPDAAGVWTSISAVQELAGGGLILAGLHEHNRLLMRVGADGTITWQKILPDLGPFTSGGTYPVDLAPATGGGVILASRMEAYDDENENWYHGVVVLEVDGGGEILWQKRYRTNRYGRYAGIGPTDDGYFVATYNDGPWVLKIDRSGEIVWQRSYVNEGYYDVLTAMDVTADGGLLLTGYYGRTDTPALPHDVWVLKIDGNGNIVWQKAYVWTDNGDWWGCGSPSWIEETADGGMIVACTLSPGGALIKLTASGDLSWARGYAVGYVLNTGAGDTFDSVQQTADGGYIVSGSVWPDANKPQFDVWLVRLNEAGAVIWSRSYGYDLAVEFGDEDYGLVAIPSGDGYLIAGRTHSLSSFDAAGLVMRVDANGEIGQCDLVHPLPPISAIDLSLVVSDTTAQVISTAETAEDTALQTMDSEATMVELCVADAATIAGQCGP